MTNYDLVVLGGGSGGYAAALRAGELGLRVALVEKGQARRHLPAPRLHPDQGDPARRRGGRRYPGRGAGSVSTPPSSGSTCPAVNAYARLVVGRLYKGLTGLIAGAAITVIEGEGRLEAGGRTAPSCGSART